MKIVTKLFLSLCLVAGLAATLTANAQIRSDATTGANIPYSFVMNELKSVVTHELAGPALVGL